MPNAIAGIIAYHERTKHHPGRYASGPRNLDWATQPNPFRRFTGAPLFPLPLAGADPTPPAAALFGALPVAPQTLTLETLGLFFELSLGLSARKQIADASWYLRINPSSGNLHPTEAYAVLPGLTGLPGGAGVYHYAPFEQALEQRARWQPPTAAATNAFHVGLTSITWREAWKYGERAFRYCQHDVGHALAALRFAAAALGWRVQFLPEWDDARLARLLGLDRPEDFADAERETPELLVRVTADDAPVNTLMPADTASEWLATRGRDARATNALMPAADTIAWLGHANRLSESQVEWPVITEAVKASERINPERGPIPSRGSGWLATAFAAHLQPYRQRLDSPAPQRGGFRRRHAPRAGKIPGHIKRHATPRCRSALRCLAVCPAAASGLVRASGHWLGSRFVSLAAGAGGRGSLAPRVPRKTPMGGRDGHGPVITLSLEVQDLAGLVK